MVHSSVGLVHFMQSQGNPSATWTNLSVFAAKEQRVTLSTTVI
jgi:hypothetical protein